MTNAKRQQGSQETKWAGWGVGICQMIAAISLLGCGPSPKSMFNAMKEAACSADISGFFHHIDKNRMQGSIQKNTGPASGSSLRSISAVRIREIFTEWEADIKKGEHGELCKMEFVTSTETGTYGSLRWKNSAGKGMRFEVERFGDQWRVVGMD